MAPSETRNLASVDDAAEGKVAGQDTYFAAYSNALQSVPSASEPTMKLHNPVFTPHPQTATHRQRL